MGFFLVITLAVPIAIATALELWAGPRTWAARPAAAMVVLTGFLYLAFFAAYGVENCFEDCTIQEELFELSILVSAVLAVGLLLATIGQVLLQAVKHRRP